MTGTPKAIIFDKDGCLFDFQKTWAAWTGGVIAHLAGGDAAKAGRLAGVLGYDVKAGKILPESEVVAGTPHDIAGLISGVTGDPTEDILVTLNHMATTAPQAVVPNLPQALAALQAMGLRLAVMTNDTEAPARAHLTKGGIIGHFDLIVGSDSGLGAKPDPDPLLAIAGHLGVVPSDMVMVGTVCMICTRDGRRGCARLGF